jgi:hypothetical protein
LTERRSEREKGEWERGELDRQRERRVRERERGETETERKREERRGKERREKEKEREREGGGTEVQVDNTSLVKCLMFKMYDGGCGTKVLQQTIKRDRKTFNLIVSQYFYAIRLEGYESVSITCIMTYVLIIYRQ